MKTLLRTALVALFCGMAFASFCQTETNDFATINFFRLQESMMSGGRSLTVKVFLDDKEIGQVLTNTRMTYKLFTTGTIKLKCIAEFGSSAIGSPYAETVTFEKGKEYNYSFTVGSMTGVKVKVPDDKELKSLLKNKYADTVVAEEKK